MSRIVLVTSIALLLCGWAANHSAIADQIGQIASTRGAHNPELVTPGYLSGSNVKLYPVPAETPGPLTEGPDGNVWFLATTCGCDLQYGKVTPAGVFTIYPYYTQGVAGLDIASGPYGLWFTGVVGAEPAFVQQVSTNGNLGYEFTFSRYACSEGVAEGTQGDAWVVDRCTNTIFRITLSGNWKFYKIPTANSSPWGIARGPDGNIWFTERQGSKVAKITTHGKITEYPFPNGLPTEIISGPDGNLYVLSDSTATITRVTTAGTLTSYPIHLPPSFTAMAVGPNKKIWITHQGNNGEAVLESFDIRTHHAAPPLHFSFKCCGSITQGSDGDMWFTAGQAIAVFEP